MAEQEFYISKYYTSPEIDQRLLQGLYDDAVKMGYPRSKTEFESQLASVVSSRRSSDNEELEDPYISLITEALRKTQQTLTEAEKTQVRENLSIPSVSDLSAEKARAKSAEGALDGRITEVQQGSNAAIEALAQYAGEIDGKVTEETERAQEAEHILSDRIDSIKPVIIEEGGITNNADEEDLTAVDEVLKFKDRDSLSGMGYVILRKNKTFAEQVTKPNTIYEIRYDFDLNGEEVTIPEGCVLKFEGGSLRNGKLNGTLLNSSFNATNFGIKYNRETAEVENTHCLSILEGINSHINLTFSEDVYFGDISREISIKNINIDGCGNTINVNNFKGIKSNRCSITNSRIKSSNRSILFKLSENAKNNSFVCENNYISGDIRLLSSLIKADENKYGINSIIISNNVFENIYYSSTGNVLFHIEDTLFNTIELSNNVVHNFSCVVLWVSITNDSKEEIIIGKDEEYSRNIIIKNNRVYNDLDYRFWEEDYYIDQTYHCFCLVEGGTCLYDNNHVENILMNKERTDGSALGINVYDNYFSVNNLIYTNNTRKNIGNLKTDSRYLLKAKEGTGSRVYKNNLIIQEDLSILLGEEDLYGKNTILQTFESDFERLIFENNRIETKYLVCNLYQRNKFKESTYNNNIIICDNLIGKGRPGFFSLDNNSENFSLIVTNNIIKSNNFEYSSSYNYIPTLLGHTEACKYGKVFVSDNYVENCGSLYTGWTDNEDFITGLVQDNIIVAKGRNLGIIYSKIGNVDVRENTIIVDIQNESEVFVLYKNFSPCYSTNHIRIKNIGKDSLLYGIAGSQNNLKNIIEVKYDGKHSLYEFNKKDNIQSYDENGDEISFTNGNIKIKDLVGEINSTFLSSTGLLFNQFVLYKHIEVTIQSIYCENNEFINIPKSSNSVNINASLGDETYNKIYKKALYYDGENWKDSNGDTPAVKKGTSAQRPTGVNDGFEYYDTTIRQPIYWNESRQAWINADGYAAGVRSGRWQIRKDLQESLTGLDGGLQFFDLSLGKVVVWTGYTWVNVDGSGFEDVNPEDEE